MTYTKRDDVPVSEGWLAVELDTGDVVAVRCDRKRVAAGVAYHACAKAIDEAGEQRMNASGAPIRTEFKQSEPVGVIDRFGDDAIARECMLAVLGEPTSLIPWADTLLTSVSIRVSLAAAPITGAVDAGVLL